MIVAVRAPMAKMGIELSTCTIPLLGKRATYNSIMGADNIVDEATVIEFIIKSTKL
jgi:hypothetical protein